MRCVHAVVGAAPLVSRNSGLGPHGERDRPASFIDRVAFEAQLPIDPLGNASALPPPVDVFVPCGPRDERLLSFCIDGIMRSVSNPISRIVVVSPDQIADRFKRADVVWIRDGEVLSQKVEAILGTVAESRRAWIRQQLIKLRMVAFSQAEATLVVDADTILLSKRSWYDGERQILTPSHEFHSPYHQLNARLLGAQHVAMGVSFVAHHQLMQRKILSSFFGSTETSYISAVELIAASLNSSEASSFSEYEIYSNLLLGTHPQSAVLARWANRPVPRERLFRLGSYQQIRDCFRHNASVSAHWYLKERLWVRR
jgi:hypothetical protein